jgi:hypothetical protein
MTKRQVETGAHTSLSSFPLPPPLLAIFLAFSIRFIFSLPPSAPLPLRMDYIPAPLMPPRAIKFCQAGREGREMEEGVSEGEVREHFLLSPYRQHTPRMGLHTHTHKHTHTHTPPTHADAQRERERDSLSPPSPPSPLSSLSLSLSLSLTLSRSSLSLSSVSLSSLSLSYLHTSESGLVVEVRLLETTESQLCCWALVE